MDFAYDDDQQAISDLAARLLAEESSHERQRTVERSGGPRFDPALWRQLAESGLLGSAVPEEYGGAGLGFLEVAAICEQLGRHTAAVPYAETVVGGVLPLVEFGSESQKRAWLPRVAAGEAVLSAALQEDQTDPAHPAAKVRRDGEAFVLEGCKLPVSAGAQANLVLVPAAFAEGQGDLGVFLVDPEAPGVTRVPLETTSGQPAAALELDAVRVPADAILGSEASGRFVLEWMLLRATAAQCAQGLGVCEEALAQTAAYVKERKQFGQPIAMFQAVGHRAADAFIDVQAIRLTTLQACWRVAAGLPAEREVALAKFWVAEAGARVVAASQHLHGGMGVDRDYPVHRFYLFAKQLELDLGGSTAQLRRIGRMLAEMPLEAIAG